MNIFNIKENNQQREVLVIIVCLDPIPILDSF